MGYFSNSQQKRFLAFRYQQTSTGTFQTADFTDKLCRLCCIQGEARTLVHIRGLSWCIT